METVDVIVVGGGPAGSSCAARLVQAGASVLVFDREEFPRTKLCAGWITPEVVEDLALDVEEYPHRFNTFNGIVVHLKWLKFTLPSVQHSIRRFEFDDWLLRRSGARALRHNVRNIERDGDGFTVDGAFRSKYLVGAGGTRCPVYRTFFRDANPRARELQAATYEHEFPHRWHDERCHLWFFEKGLPGYAWYVPKADGYLNCGIGGMAEKLKARGEDIKRHWRHFLEVLARRGTRPGRRDRPEGIQLLPARRRGGGTDRKRVHRRRLGRSGDAGLVRGNRPRGLQRSSRRGVDPRGQGVPPRRSRRLQLGHRNRAAYAGTGVRGEQAPAAETSRGAGSGEPLNRHAPTGFETRCRRKLDMQVQLLFTII